MKARNHSIVPFAITFVHKKGTWISTLEQSMREQNHSTVPFVITFVHKKGTWRSTLEQSMRVKTIFLNHLWLQILVKRKFDQTTLHHFMRARIAVAPRYSEKTESWYENKDLFKKDVLFYHPYLSRYIMIFYNQVKYLLLKIVLIFKKETQCIWFEICRERSILDFPNSFSLVTDWLWRWQIVKKAGKPELGVE